MKRLVFSPRGVLVEEVIHIPGDLARFEEAQKVRRKESTGCKGRRERRSTLAPEIRVVRSPDKRLAGADPPGGSNCSPQRQTGGESHRERPLESRQSRISKQAGNGILPRGLPPIVPC